MNIIGECGKIFLLKEGKVYVYKRGEFREVPIVDAPQFQKIGGGDDEKDP